MVEWISIKNELPKLLERVILFDSNGFLSISGRRGSNGWYLDEILDKNADITHWMPLPEPPKGNTND